MNSSISRGRRNLVSARVPSHFKRSLLAILIRFQLKSNFLDIFQKNIQTYNSNKNTCSRSDLSRTDITGRFGEANSLFEIFCQCDWYINILSGGNQNFWSAQRSRFNNNNNNNNNKIPLLKFVCHPVAVVILHVYKIWNWLLINLSREGYMRSM